MKRVGSGRLRAAQMKLADDLARQVTFDDALRALEARVKELEDAKASEAKPKAAVKPHA